jgi:hypothetical protein
MKEHPPTPALKAFIFMISRLKNVNICVSFSKIFYVEYKCCSFTKIFAVNQIEIQSYFRQLSWLSTCQCPFCGSTMPNLSKKTSRKEK